MVHALARFIADGSVDWLETSDEFADGDTMDPEFVKMFLKTIDCYGVVSAECLSLALADDLRYSIPPILIGDGIPFFKNLDSDVALHLAEVKAWKSGMVELHYEVQAKREESRNSD